VGKRIASLLASKGYGLTILTRSPGTKGSKGYQYALFDADNNRCDTTALAGLNAVIHLAGESVAGKRWTAAQKEKIASSRIAGTRFLVDMLQAHAPSCKTFIGASAIGYYGPDSVPPKPFTESSPVHPDFLGTVCRQWEEEENRAAGSMRAVNIRIGIVLAPEAGAFREFAKPLSFGIMPILGSGKQFISWIHVDDLAQLFVKALEDNTMTGAYNGVAPAPVDGANMMRTIAAVKGGLAIPAPVPAFVLKIALGEMSIEILKSCTVSAEKILRSGFNFRYPDLHSAVTQLLKG
jgi:uncharacterized protein (TIGR01777 family)